jgi:Protein of unknown function (DUF2550)
VQVFDAIAVVALIAVIVVLALIIARQRHMLNSAGAIPLAVRRGTRWLYGVARYNGEEFRWYRAIDLGPTEAELRSLPPTAVIVECRDRRGDITLALADGAFTGFVSWLESSAPRA